MQITLSSCNNIKQEEEKGLNLHSSPRFINQKIQGRGRREELTSRTQVSKGWILVLRLEGQPQPISL